MMIKFASAFVLAALAVTMSIAGTPTNLRSMSPDDSGQYDSDSALDTSVNEDHASKDNLTSNLADTSPDSGSQVDILSVIDSSNDQVGVKNPGVDAIKVNTDLNAYGVLNDRLPWVSKTHLKGEADYSLGKEGIIATNTDGSVDDLLWLGDDDTESPTKEQSLNDPWLHNGDSPSGSDKFLVVKGAKDSASYNLDLKVLEALDDVFDYSKNERGPRFGDSGNKIDDPVSDGRGSRPTTMVEPVTSIQRSPTSTTTLDSTLEEYWGSMADSDSFNDDTWKGKSPVPTTRASKIDDSISTELQLK